MDNLIACSFSYSLLLLWQEIAYKNQHSYPKAGGESPLFNQKNQKMRTLAYSLMMTRKKVSLQEFWNTLYIYFGLRFRTNL
jgi:hypothetical protein